MATDPTVLIVDDRTANIVALEAALRELPVQILTALNGDAALRLLLERDVAVILLDVEMPEIDGFETASLIRQRERSYRTPIIFVTAAADADFQIRNGYKLGAVDYMI